ncbi:MAG: pyridoxal phosphate-dependent aminotransferase [Anaerolineales bacterium]|nr:pyridoxal phosphate-dependent aminotransferase [Anaerolineales bacterium]
MKYDFDREINRKGTNSVKWEFIKQRDDLLYREEPDDSSADTRLLPMWVADMDFPCPGPVVDALVERAQHRIFGYTSPTESYYGAIVNWMKKRHGWEIEPEWICTTPGVVPALNMVVKTYISPGDSVLIQTPVYYPFNKAVENSDGVLVTNSLIYEDGRYSMDFADLEEKTKDPQVKMAILCSPHNPVGRVWTRDELVRFGEICINNNVLVVSDEIHGDLILDGFVFTPFAGISEAFAQNSITCTAPSKTFNLAGLKTSNIIIPNEQVRSRYKKTLERTGLRGVGAFGVVALEAAYNHGEEWLAQVLDYIMGNLRCLEEYIAEHLPQITVVPLEGTYLVWLDCRRLGLGKLELEQVMLKEAKVYLDEGYIFGIEGEGFERINIACPRSVLVEALERIRKVIERMKPGMNSDKNEQS